LCPGPNILKPLTGRLKANPAARLTSLYGQRNAVTSPAPLNGLSANYSSRNVLLPKIKLRRNNYPPSAVVRAAETCQITRSATEYSIMGSSSVSPTSRIFLAWMDQARMNHARMNHARMDHVGV